MKVAEKGFNTELKFGKKSGTWTWFYLQKIADAKFDPSDMGFFTNNNFFDQQFNYGYQVYKPSSWYNKWEAWSNLRYSRLYKPGSYQNFGVDGNYYVEFKNFWSVETNFDWQRKGQDFYESRNAGRVFRPERITVLKCM